VGKVKPRQKSLFSLILGEPAHLAWVAFLQAHVAVTRELEREMEEEQGLPLSWYEILARLCGASEGRLRLQSLEEFVLLSRSGLTRMVDRMSKAGLVRREPCLEDHRGVYVVITQKGRTIVERATPTHIQGIQRHFLASLDEHDIQSLHGVLSKVVQGKHIAVQCPSPPPRQSHRLGGAKLVVSHVNS
jgi:DNA-binding MarR family transcriptional regulator